MYGGQDRWASGRDKKTGTERGFALVSVVMAIAILSTFLLVALAYTLNNLGPARRGQDAKSAQQAALAGIDEYLSRLAGDSSYWQKGNNDSTNAAFTSAGRTIQGTGGASSTSARYSYSLLSSVSDVSSSGVIRLRVTGMSGPAGGTGTVSRTMTVELKRSGLLDYVYLTDYEVIDPALVNGPSTCAAYYYALGTQPARSGKCSEIQWGANDTVNGPLHSNDALQINGSVNFTNPKTETSWPDTKGAADGAPTWWGKQNPPLTGYPPKYVDTIALPESNNELLNHVPPNIDVDGQVGKGCYYTGATRIILQGSTMRVLSPATSSSGVPARCYNTAASARGSEQTVAVPPVIYVGNTASTCAQVGYPATGELTPTQTGVDDASWQATVTKGGTAYSYQTTNYACGRGTVFVQGTTSVPVTVAGYDDVVVTGDLKVSATNGATLVGLIAGNCVWVYHPAKSGGTNQLPVNLNSSANVTTIQAAILALGHSFVVQNWNAGSSLGDLNVYGAIAQKFRGPVGTSNSSGGVASGYAKKYTYDGRLANIQPPYFLNAGNSPYKISGLTDG
ncbi:type IV pilus modification PilV family protein [Kineosporia succinea]|uniref:Type II secretory pathway pseudopilin PulG n=1 Tax=Kineosporia succinea TaxID=84632 RepID=A0ABT9NVX9_9ACTN|nr:type II secretion system protein [Kineosporia succinea]MDP9824309.1 type II secretory pathway pseudopilin PulG [Kineosporia succinea]